VQTADLIPMFDEYVSKIITFLVLWLVLYIFWFVVQFLQSFSGLKSRVRICNFFKNIENKEYFEPMFAEFVKFLMKDGSNEHHEAAILNMER